MLERIVNVARLARVVAVSFAPDVLQVSSPAGNLTTRVVTLTGCPRLLLALLNSDLLDRRLGTVDAPGGGSVETLSVKEDPPFGIGLG